MHARHPMERSGGTRKRWYRVGAGLMLCAAQALAAPPRLPIRPHTVRPRYAYVLGARALHVQRDCRPDGQALLQLRIQVINRGTRRIALPVRLRAGFGIPGARTLRVPVPELAPGGSAWLRLDVPFVPDRHGSSGALLQVALTSAGQAWNRLSLPAPRVGGACPRGRSRVAPHAGGSAR